jgi:hypothetical protein
MVELFRKNILKTLRLEHQRELLPPHEMTMIEDEATLAAADTKATL